MGGGGDTFLQQFMAGWQMGQQRREGQRRDQMMMMQQQQEAQRMQADAQERAARIEALKLQKERLDWERKKEELDLKLSLGQVTSKQTQVLPPQTEDLGGGTTLDMGPMTAPTPPIMADLPEGGQFQVPFYEDIQARKEAEQQAKNRAALGLREEELKLAEPYKISDDERAAKLAAQRDAALESRMEARYRRQVGNVNKQADALRKEYNSQIKTYLPQLDNFNKASALAAKPDDARTPADDMALVFIFMRSLDPGSTVREGEYATATNAAGVPDRVRNAYNSALNGTFLSPDQRKAFAGAIERDFAAGPGKAISTIQNRYRYLGQQAGIENPDQMILMDIGGVGGGSAPPGGDYEPTSVPGVRRRKR